MAERTCMVDGCDRVHYGRGCCAMHYSRFKRHGTLPQRATIEERFWAKVDKDGPVPERRPELGPCWLWTASKLRHGYGNFAWSPEEHCMQAHRASWRLTRGPIPDRLVIDHLCEVHACVRPEHLEPVTQLVNVRRGSRTRHDPAAPSMC